MRKDVPMSVRKLIVEIDLEGLNVTEFCRQHGVSRWLFYQLRKRYAAYGDAGLEPRSRAPKTVPNRTPDWVEDVIVELRKQLSDDGFDAGPATIRYHLGQRVDDSEVPSEATIWRILVRRGFITPEPKKAPKHAHRRFAAERANECWQLDDIEWELVDGTGVEIISIIDDCTRFSPMIKAVETVNGDTAFAAFAAGGNESGFPERFLSDNATEYRYTLARAVGALGVDHGHGRPNHPQTQGKVERFQQTLQKWLTAQTTAETLKELQTQLDTFRDIYNNIRPHRAIGRKPPATVYATTPRSGPKDRPLGTPTSIHTVTVSNGVVYINKQYTITIGAKYNTQTATVIITGTSCHIFIGATLTRQLQLNPTRRTQPLYNRPGKP